jgi:hypothetical protein
VPANSSSVFTADFPGQDGGDNFGECTLDTQVFTGVAPGVSLAVSNTNTSQSTEEGDGFGYAMLDWTSSLAAQAAPVPLTISLSLGSLSYRACELLCEGAVKQGVSPADCEAYMQTQRQVCMFDSNEQVISIRYGQAARRRCTELAMRSDDLAKITARGATIVAAAGDGGSHFSFGEFPSDRIGTVLNSVSCALGSVPTFPSASPWVLSVGGTQWTNGPDQPVAWRSGGSGFSWIFPQPAYQSAAVQAYLAAYGKAPGFPGPATFNASGRAYPDVSALADNVPVVMDGSLTPVGGTSASAPEVAGIVALVNDARLNRGLPPLGFLNPRLYQAAAAHQSELFFDVVSGNRFVCAAPLRTTPTLTPIAASAPTTAAARSVTLAAPVGTR